MNCIKWRFISWGIGIVGSIPFIIAFMSDDFWGSPLAYIGIITIVIAATIGIVKFRCPKCNRHISDHSPVDISNCPYCGSNLK